jgi:TonB family protein
MALAPLSLSRLAEDRQLPGGGVLPPSDYPLHLLLEWPGEPSRRKWGILAASVAIHLLLFGAATRLPSLIEPTRPPARRIVEHHIPLYLPRDLTQKAPNRAEVTKKIDLSELLAEQHEQRAQRAAPRPSVKRFELPKQAREHVAKSIPQILPEAPKVALNQPLAPLPAGASNGLPVAAPPPPTPAPGPFQNIGTEAPPNPNPKLAPPKDAVQAAVNDLLHGGSSSHVIISDNSPTEPQPDASGVVGQLGAQHAAVELQSDPQGADFKAYLTRILAIVRANWRQVIPEPARRGALHGTTVLEFIINRDGSIPKLVTAESSGLDPLDRAAVAGLSMSNPLPPLPADYKGFQVRLAFSFAYNMPSR